MYVCVFLTDIVCHIYSMILLIRYLNHHQFIKSEDAFKITQYQNVSAI